MLEEFEIIKMKVDALERKIDEKTHEIKYLIHNLQDLLCNEKAVPETHTQIPKGSSTTLHSTNLSSKYTTKTSICTIPQLDGSLNLSAITPSVKKPECDNCHEVFENETELNKHNEKFEFGCEDCSICFTSKLMYDHHELEKHPILIIPSASADASADTSADKSLVILNFLLNFYILLIEVNF